MPKVISNLNFIDALLEQPYFNNSRVLSWSPAATVGQSVSLTYDFMTVAPSGPDELALPGGNFQQFTAAQRDATVTALGLISEVANISFSRNTVGRADMEFGMAALGGSAQSYTAGLAQTRYTHDNIDGTYTLASVWMTNQFGNVNDIAPGSSNFSTLIHEILHAVGFDHPFQGVYTLPAAQDTEQFTVMSYTGHPQGLNPRTMMLYDMAALQYLYGANMTTRTGNDTYSFPAGRLATIWDAGGSDTILGTSLAGGGDTINLFAGAFSSLGGQTNNVAIAFGVTIENAIGGAGNDIIYGNDAGNFISGGSYSPTNGSDYMDGGNGFDTVSWNDAPIGAVVNLVNNALNGGAAAGDTVLNFESFLLTAYGDTLYGNFTGVFVYAFGGADQIFGSLASDVIDGGAGGDFIDGNEGFDYASYHTSPTGITVNLLSPGLNTGFAAGDTYARVEAFILTEFSDVFVGANGANFAFGYGGADQFYGAVSSNDWFFGGAGNDLLSGGSLNDLLSGGEGADTYVFLDDATNGFDSILDFTSGVDAFAVDDVGFGLFVGQVLINGFNFVGSAAPLPVAGLATFLYNTTNGILSFDPDGTGGGAQTPLAQILGAPLVASSDIVVI